MKKILSAILMLSIVLLICTCMAENAAPEVKCTNGVFRGTYENETGVMCFKGIPYAKPPVGELRWKAPIEPDASDKTYDATKFGKVCLQTESTEHVSEDESGEDCLTLNIWTSDLKTKNKPVMVWIHGGSYGWGGTSDYLYNGQYLVKAYGDLIVVTINYRLNLLGFADFSGIPGGESYTDAPYLGILDQQMALKWIQKNIGNFGGDPNNVTIFGESAGGGSVISLMVAKNSEGLFRRAIVMSGAGLNDTKSDYDEKNQIGELLKAVGGKTMDDLTSLSEKELLKAMYTDTGRRGTETGSRVADLNNFPMKDDLRSIIPEVMDKAIIDRAGKVDLLIGTVGDEMRYWVEEMEEDSEAENVKEFYDFIRDEYHKTQEKSPEQADKIEAALAVSRPANDGKYSEIYPGIWEYADVVSDINFRCPSIRFAEKHHDTGSDAKTYMYLFNKCNTLNDWEGACHGSELLYTFDNIDDDYEYSGKAVPELAADFSAALVAFARTGDPSTDKHPWPEYTPEDRLTMVVNDDNTMTVETDPKRIMRELLKDVKKY